MIRNHNQSNRLFCAAPFCAKIFILRLVVQNYWYFPGIRVLNNCREASPGPIQNIDANSLEQVCIFEKSTPLGSPGAVTGLRSAKVSNRIFLFDLVANSSSFSALSVMISRPPSSLWQKMQYLTNIFLR